MKYSCGCRSISLHIFITDFAECISGLDLCLRGTSAGSSGTERSLDQQCTVTRPGLGEKHDNVLLFAHYDSIGDFELVTAGVPCPVTRSCPFFSLHGGVSRCRADGGKIFENVFGLSLMRGITNLELERTIDIYFHWFSLEYSCRIWGDTQTGPPRLIIVLTFRLYFHN